MRGLQERGPGPAATPCGCVKPALETGNCQEGSGAALRRGLGAGGRPHRREGRGKRDLQPRGVLLLLNVKARVTCTSDHVMRLRRAGDGI